MSDFLDKESNVEKGSEVLTVVLKVIVSTAGMASMVVDATTAWPTLGAALVGELVESVAPNLWRQRIERLIVAFGEEVETLKLEVEHLRRRVNTPEFIDLVQDACMQSARAVTDERIRTLAKMLKNSLNDEHLKYMYSKRLLSMLSELNDVEVILLKSYSVEVQAQENFWSQYPDVRQTIGNEYKPTIQFSAYELHLVRLGLIGPTKSYGSPKDLTPLGASLLLKMGHPVEKRVIDGRITDGTEGLQEVEQLLRHMRQYRP